MTWFFWLSACIDTPDLVQMYGFVYDDLPGSGDVVPGATLSTFDIDGAAVDEVTAEADGSFSVAVPAGVDFFLQVSADGYTSTGFSATAGIADFYAGDGLPWVAPPAWIGTLRETFANCPTVGEPGAMTWGQVRVWNNTGSIESMPIPSNAKVTVVDGEGGSREACYLDDEGNSVTDAETAGATGQYAAFGLPAGGIALEISYTNADGIVPLTVYQFLVPEDGLVPVYPALVSAE